MSFSLGEMRPTRAKINLTSVRGYFLSVSAVIRLFQIEIYNGQLNRQDVELSHLEFHANGSTILIFHKLIKITRRIVKEP